MKTLNKRVKVRCETSYLESVSLAPSVACFILLKCVIEKSVTAVAVLTDRESPFPANSFPDQEVHPHVGNWRDHCRMCLHAAL